jgi:hypothetical protein
VLGKLLEVRQRPDQRGHQKLMGLRAKTARVVLWK